MNKDWPKLEKPPVVIAIFQLKFSKSNFDIKETLQYDELIKHILPYRDDAVAVGVNFDRTNIQLGQSQIIGTSNAEISCYVYYSQNKKNKLELSKDTISFISEENYIGWSDFKERVMKFLKILSPILEQSKIMRSSIRFINRFDINDFSDPSQYFKTLITTSLQGGQTTYPLQQYGFRLLMNIPGTDIHSIVNHNVENVAQTQYLYTLDIDVLDKQNLIFTINSIEEKIDILRNVKNQIFFDTLTEKTISICNCR